MTTTDRAVELLNALGDTADEVAAALHGLGIVGYRRDSAECPIARFLNAQLGADTDAIVHDAALAFGEWYEETETPLLVTAGSGSPDSSLGPAAAPRHFSIHEQALPQPVREFIWRFDVEGAYRDLREVAPE